MRVDAGRWENGLPNGAGMTKAYIDAMRAIDKVCHFTDSVECAASLQNLFVECSLPSHIKISPATPRGSPSVMFPHPHSCFLVPSITWLPVYLYLL